jgi:hypothetical protein
MKENYENIFNSERSVETLFIVEMLNKYTKKKSVVLDVGGIPTSHFYSQPITEWINNHKEVIYKICDFRGGEYQGDFLTLDIKEKFDIIMFISSLEHFPECTEDPNMKHVDGKDIDGFKKSLSLLKNKGLIFLTVPFGKHLWQEYHQNYDWNGILKLTEGSKIIESFTYKLENNQWVIEDPKNMEHILYTDKAFGVGCFVLQKE